MTAHERPQLINFKNGEKVQPTFSAKEMNNRVARLRSRMAESDIDVALFTSIHNINYYADFLYCSFGRPFGLVITHNSHTTVSANVDGGQPWRQSLADNIVYTDWQPDNYFRALQKADPGQSPRRN